MPLPTSHKLPHKLQLSDPLLHSVCRQTALHTAVIMKAVILVLLLVAATLVHSAPEEIEEIGKSLREYSIQSGDFINALIEGGCPIFLRYLFTHVQPRNVT
jgi:hypothetical protein